MATRMSNDTAMQVMHWHTAHGGHMGTARGHALKLFEEVVELALAAGASKQDLLLVMTGQFKREDDKKLMDPNAAMSSASSTLSATHLQILRCIDKTDKLGKDGVVELLQKPLSEFGADLDPVFAGVVGMLLHADLNSVRNVLLRASRVRSRLALIVLLDETQHEDKPTALDYLISMPTNRDNTWSNGGRPENIAWALDDILELLCEDGEDNG